MEVVSFGAKSEPSRYLHFKGLPQKRTLLETLLGASGLREDRSRWLVEFGATYLNSKRILDPNVLVGEDDVIRVHFDPKRYQVNRGDLLKRVVFENDLFLIVDKPSGLPMHPTLDNLYENLVHGFDFPVYVTHRLDVPTSGLVVLAKTKEFQRQFNTLIMNRGVEKFYQAFSCRPVPVGLLQHFMKVSVKAPKIVVREIPQGDENDYETCRLEVLSCHPFEPSPGIWETQIKLLTGRTHQIRAQLAAVGAPLVGDEMYGGIKDSSFGLHACGLNFKCPLSGQNYTFQKLAQCVKSPSLS